MRKIGLGKMGSLSQLFLRFSSHVQLISNIFSTFPRRYFWKFLTIPHFPAFSPISPRSPPIPPHFAAIFPSTPFLRASAARWLTWLRLAQMFADPPPPDIHHCRVVWHGMVPGTVQCGVVRCNMGRYGTAIAQHVTLQALWLSCDPLPCHCRDSQASFERMVPGPLLHPDQMVRCAEV